MAVPKTKRTEGRLHVATKAIELESYTMDMCGAEKRIPKKERPFVAYPMVDAVRTITSDIYRANDVYAWDERSHRQRIEYMEHGLAEMANLLHLMDVAYKRYNIKDNSIVHWVGLAKEVRTKLRNWRNAEKRAYIKRWQNDENFTADKKFAGKRSRNVRTRSYHRRKKK